MSIFRVAASYFAISLTLANSDAESSKRTGLVLAAPLGIHVREVIILEEIAQENLQTRESIKGNVASFAIRKSEPLVDQPINSEDPDQLKLPGGL